MKAVGKNETSAHEALGDSSLVVQMLTYQVDGRHDQTGDAASFVSRLHSQPGLADELTELVDMLEARSGLMATPVPGMEDTPLVLHATYGIREILTAVGWWTADRRIPFQAGVLPPVQRQTELLFVTLDKSDGYHDRISYHDYAISAERFHWQTQNSAGQDTPAGRRYLAGRQNGWQFQLFIRARREDVYRACGPVLFESAEGDRPMSIIWKFGSPLPARLFREFSVLRGV